jgi:hypothetical protein
MRDRMDYSNCSNCLGIRPAWRPAASNQVITDFILGVISFGKNRFTGIHETLWPLTTAFIPRIYGFYRIYFRSFFVDIMKESRTELFH